MEVSRTAIGTSSCETSEYLFSGPSFGIWKRLRRIHTRNVKWNVENSRTTNPPRSMCCEKPNDEVFPSTTLPTYLPTPSLSHTLDLEGSHAHTKQT